MAGYYPDIVGDGIAARKAGYDEMDKFSNALARRQAGNAMASGDAAGGQNMLYRAGLFDEAGQVQDRQYRNEYLGFQRDQMKASAEEKQRERADAQRKAQLETIGKASVWLKQRATAAQAGGPESVRQALSEGFDQVVPFLDGADPSKLAEYKAAILANPAVLDAIGAQAAKELQAVNLGNGGVAVFDKSTGDLRTVREPQYEQEYVALPPGGALVPKPRGNAPPQTVTAGPGGGDWLGAVSAAAPDAQVTSGLRTPERNAAVGGKPNSRHLSGQAVDLVPRPGETMAQLYARVSKVPGVKAINEGDHVHVQVAGGQQAQGQGQYPPGTIMGPPKQEDAPSGYRWEGGKLTFIPGGPADPATKANSTTGRKEIAAIRKEFNQLEEVKTWKDVRASYNQVRALATKPNPTPADDIALTYSFMKMLDPGSVVREGEYALVGRAAGLDDRIVMALARIDKGQGLTPDIRKRLRASASEVLLQRRGAFDQVAGQYRDIYTDAGGDPNELAEAPGAWRGRIRTPGAPAKAPAKPSGGWGKLTVR